MGSIVMTRLSVAVLIICVFFFLVRIARNLLILFNFEKNSFLYYCFPYSLCFNLINFFFNWNIVDL